MTPDVPLVLVVVGTDYHPFDRLVEWIDAWLLKGDTERVRCVVQYGGSAPPKVATGHDYLAVDELRALMANATVIVCHGGPATIAEARRAGRMPIVVPRDDQFGEHVDNHQQLFARRLAESGLVALATSDDDLRALLDSALADPASFAVTPDVEVERTAASARFLGELVDELVADASRERATAAVPVLYLGGLGRSGSTLVDRILGQLPGVCAVGEVVHMWERGLLRNERCGCGVPFSECPFWTEVGRVAFGGWDRVDPHRVLAVKASVDRTRFVPLLVAPWLSRRYRRRLTAYGELLGRLCAAIRTVSGADVVVDSSKHASFALVLHNTPLVTLRVGHIVRDSRGVAHSWGKLVQRPEITDDEAYMPVYSPVKTALQWDLDNVLFLALARLGAPTAVVRYEDFVASPRREIARLVELAGLPTDAVATVVGDGHVDLGVTHTVAGNPMRFHTGSVALRADEAWRSELPPHRRQIVSVLTWPVRRRFGYAD